MEKAAIWKPGTESSGETGPANTLTPDVRPPDCARRTVCCLGHQPVVLCHRTSLMETHPGTSSGCCCNKRLHVWKQLWNRVMGSGCRKNAGATGPSVRPPRRRRNGKRAGGRLEQRQPVDKRGQELGCTVLSVLWKVELASKETGYLAGQVWPTSPYGSR